MITVNGDPFPWREGLTVSEVMKEKNFKFRLISVWVGDNFIDKERYAEVKIPDGRIPARSEAVSREKTFYI